jgi:phosphonopyruvate decarboxylase
MVDPSGFAQSLADFDVRFFAGVPDSLLAPLIAAFPSPAEGSRHVIAANEGNAVALAAGYHLATTRVACVYMQNSGLGNALNPLLSLCHRSVHGIPLLLLVGWRGEPGRPDEPQHLAQGEVTLGMLQAAGVPHRVLGETTESAVHDLRAMLQATLDRGAPSALVVPHGRFEGTLTQRDVGFGDCMDRRDAIAVLDRWCSAVGAVAFATTGNTIREIIALHGLEVPPPNYFLNFGAMGHVSQLALAYALHRADTPVLCIDGDGSALMHLGGLATIGRQAPPNFLHVVLNNRAHGSVGGFPTCASVDFRSISGVLGFGTSLRATSGTELTHALDQLGRSTRTTTMLEVLVRMHPADDLPRPRFTARENKAEFLSACSLVARRVP